MACLQRSINYRRRKEAHLIYNKGCVKRVNLAIQA